MIYTVTLNPSVDYFMKFDKTVISDVNRVSESHFVAAGKGINVSKILDVLGIPSEAVYFSGGRTGDFIDQALRSYKYLKAHPIQIEGLTRINVKVYGSVDHAFNPQGPEIEEEAKQKLLNILEQLNSDDVVIISGSLPKGINKEYVRTMCLLISTKGARSVLDVSNFRLADYEGLDVYLIKPNADELKYILDEESIDEEKYDIYLKRIQKAGVRNILLSLGKDGALYHSEYGKYHVNAPEAEVIKSIGAGDSMLGAFVGTLIKTDDVEESLKTASAAGTAIVSCEGMPDEEMIREMKKRIEIIQE